LAIRCRTDALFVCGCLEKQVNVPDRKQVLLITPQLRSIEPLHDLCQEVWVVPAPRRSGARRLWQLLTSRQPDMAHRLSSPLMDMQLRQLLATHRFDAVQVEAIESAHLMRIIRQTSPHSLILFDDINAETLLQQRAFFTDLRRPSRWPLAAYSWIQTRRLHRFESWACRQADIVTAVSEPDANWLSGLATSGKVAAIPNAIDVSKYTHEWEGELPVYDLVFTGKMDYRPNVDAMLWLVEHVWPRVLEARPGTTLAIVGQKPHPKLIPLREKAGITVTGFVRDVRPYLQGSSVMVLPFRIGSGTRLKLIEAMASGRAIVSTPIGSEGFPVTHNEHLLLARTAQEFAASIIMLLTNDAVRKRIEVAAREFAWQYDWRNVMPCFNELLAEAGNWT
jgi:glycosyltransferase involved in cell wall biosynthesis